MEEVFVKNKAELWAWLLKHHTQTESVWLVHYKYASGKSDITRDILVDYLLCFGWIDSTPGKVDEYKTKIRISPRKPKSVWSQINKDKVMRLIKEKLMQKSGLQVVELAQAHGTWDKAYLPQSKMVMPGDFVLLMKRKGNEAAYEFFKTFDRTNQYAVYHRLTIIVDAEKREKKMNAFIEQFKQKKYFHTRSEYRKLS